ncbi:MAG: FIG00547529: putative membrane protein, partial [uncultured Blastococcus sp.]
EHSRNHRREEGGRRVRRPQRHRGTDRLLRRRPGRHGPRRQRRGGAGEGRWGQRQPLDRPGHGRVRAGVRPVGPPPADRGGVAGDRRRRRRGRRSL